SSAATSYVVNNGDTLQSIALSVWGDASMWYMIADLNGLNTSDKLTAGQILTIPNKVTNIHNNSETFRPYSPGEAIGDTQPTVPSPPPPPKPKKKCGGIAQIVMIIVAVVVTIYTAGAASAAFGALAAGTSVTTAIGTTALFSTGMAALSGASIGAAMVGAAVGSAASQLVGKAMGAVDSFSWSQVGISALTAGATAGVGAGIGQLASKGYSWAQTANNAINTVNSGGRATWAQVVGVGAYAGAVSYGSNYIANQVFGNNQSFSWAALGSSVVGSMAGASLGKSGAFSALGKASPYAYSLASAGAAATIEDKWFGGAKPDYLNVSMAAIANTVGTQFGSALSSLSENTTTTENNSLNTAEQASDLSEGYDTNQVISDDNLGGGSTTIGDVLDASKLPFDKHGKYISAEDINRIKAGATDPKHNTGLGMTEHRTEYLIKLLGKENVLSGASPNQPRVQVYSQSTLEQAYAKILKIGGGQLPMVIAYGDVNTDTILTFQSSLDVMGGGVSDQTKLKVYNNLAKTGFADLTNGINETLSYYANTAFNHAVISNEIRQKIGTDESFIQQKTKSNFKSFMLDSDAPAFIRNDARKEFYIGLALDVAAIAPVGKAANGAKSLFNLVWKPLNSVGERIAVQLNRMRGANSAIAASEKLFSQSVTTTEAKALLANSKGLKVDLFGGETSQVKGAINVDIDAIIGVKADITHGLGFIPDASVRQLTALNPYIPGRKNMFVSDVLGDAHRILEPGGEITIAATKGNPYVKIKQFPSVGELNNMGFDVVNYKLPLNQVDNYKSTLSNVSFGQTGGVSYINPEDMISIVLRRKK
ncbi:LysM peptidoglycan-binding domain-containing protein, partial [Acinetobacter modestus]|uniref:LysM peptidoglycan-binding domain-containing protein n=1 Tax=Acinetobacter modestus TaxID=1776740 RepID=UPI00301A6EEC